MQLLYLHDLNPHTELQVQTSDSGDPERGANAFRVLALYSEKPNLLQIINLSDKRTLETILTEVRTI